MPYLFRKPPVILAMQRASQESKMRWNPLRPHKHSLGVTTRSSHLLHNSLSFLVVVFRPTPVLAGLLTQQWALSYHEELRIALFLSIPTGGTAAVRAQSMEVGSFSFCQLLNLTLPVLKTSRCQSVYMDNSSYQITLQSGSQWFRQNE